MDGTQILLNRSEGNHSLDAAAGDADEGSEARAHVLRPEAEADRVAPVAGVDVDDRGDPGWLHRGGSAGSGGGQGAKAPGGGESWLQIQDPPTQSQR